MRVVEKNTGIDTDHLQQDLEWFIEVVNRRLSSYFEKDQSYFDISSISPPSLNGKPSHYTAFISKYKLSPTERLVMLLGLIPHIQPQILDVFFTKNTTNDRGFTEFGGVKGQYFSGFIPTGETAIFLLAANDLNARLHYTQIFEADHFFAREHILWLNNPHKDEPFLSGALTMSDEFVDMITAGRISKPKYSIDFPAQQIETNLTWNDLVLDSQTLDQIEEVQAWIEHGDTLLYKLGYHTKLKPGYKCLFYGPSGTGKTLTATLIGKYAEKEVYRIDLSMMVSKYIGETEKNLAKVFDKAANKDWILFFDEADALFGKRTNVGDSHDRYANQEVSFLLQKIEDHNGIVILATNLKSNIDEAFTRRFQSIVPFPIPKSGERYILWKKAISDHYELEPSVNLKKIAEDYELAGGAIINAARYAVLMSLKNGSENISEKLLLSGIRKEFQKGGKTI